MVRGLAALLLGGLCAAAVQGHALYLLPDGTDGVKVVFSDELAPDSRVKEASWKRLDGMKLFAKDGAGTITAVKAEKAEHCLACKVPDGTKVVYGQAEYGVFAKGEGKPMFLKYYPKVILGELPANASPMADPQALEVVPVREADKTRFRVVLAGKPLAGATVSVIVPEKEERKQFTTDEAGFTPAIEGTGRFGVTARHQVEQSGEVNGQKYELMTHVATLVVDVK